MSRRIIFYHNPPSRSAMVHWMLEEVGADYETRLISLDKGEQKTPELLSFNPMGKVPTIVVEGTAITETPAIIAWLSDAYPEAGLAPPVGSIERGSWYRWLAFGGSCIDPALIDRIFDRPEPPRKGALGWGSYDAVIDTLETVLASAPYLVGGKFSAADLYVGAELSWGTLVGAPRLKDSKVISDYIARVTDRPAYKRSFDADNARVTETESA